MPFKDPEKFAFFMKVWMNIVPVLLGIIAIYDFYLVIFKHNWISIVYGLLALSFVFMWIFRNKLMSAMTQTSQIDDKKIDEIEKKLENANKIEYIG